MSPLPLGVIISLLITAFFLGGVAGCKGRDMQVKSAEVAALKAANEKARALQYKLNEVSSDFEKFKADSDVVRETRTNTVREIYRDVEVSPDCAPVPAAVSVLDAAISAANSAATGKSSP